MFDECSRVGKSAGWRYLGTPLGLCILAYDAWLGLFLLVYVMCDGYDGWYDDALYSMFTTRI